jgi:hypothetical protein
MRRPTCKDGDWLRAFPDAPADLPAPAALPAVESMADLVARDPGRYYAHRTRIERVTIRPAADWAPEAMRRLMNDLGGR